MAYATRHLSCALHHSYRELGNPAQAVIGDLSIMAPQMYFSGLNRPPFFEILARQQAAGMLNALSAREPAVLRACREYPSVLLTMDSGAFQGNRDLEGYVRCIQQLFHRLQWYTTLDVVHNQQATDANYKILSRMLTEEQAAKLLYVYQAQSRGSHWCRTGDLETLRRAADQHRFLGIGGLVSVLNRNLQEAMDLLAAIGEVLISTNTEAHLLGAGNYSLLAAFSSARWFRSADSARWLQGLSSGLLLTCDGRSLNAHRLRLALTGMQCAEQNLRATLSWLQPGRVHQLALFPDVEEENELLPPLRAEHSA